MTTNPQWQLEEGGPMSLQDYLRLDHSATNMKYEYIDGVARLMSGGSVAHDRIAYNTRNVLEQHFLSGPCTVFGSDMQVLVGHKEDGRDDYLYPDVTISCDVADRRHNNKLIRSPRVIVEVLSPSTEAFDRSTKLRAYQACSSIQEVMLISQFAQHVEVYRRDSEESNTWTYVFYSSEEQVVCVCGYD